jgi:hypothetical protein
MMRFKTPNPKLTSPREIPKTKLQVQNQTVVILSEAKDLKQFSAESGKQ